MAWEHTAEHGWVRTDDTARPCYKCRKMVHAIGRESEEDAGPTHFRAMRCQTCGFHMGFTGKPPNDPTKYKRPRSTVDLVKRYSRGYCEFCLRFDHELPAGHGLEAHHVRPHQYGGPDTRENLWIVCKACHRLIEHTRTYHGPSGAMEDRPW